MRVSLEYGLIAALACGPSTPGDSTGSTGASTSSADATSSGTGPERPSTTTGGMVTTGPDTTGEPTGTSPTSSTGDATTAAGECVVDPAQDLCSEGCDRFVDCCKCNGATALPKDLGTCVLPTGIVAALCSSWIMAVLLDEVPLAEGGAACGEPEVMWVQYEQNGEPIVELCGDACTAYLDGSFSELVMQVFCEAA
ncbi:hypothetical protein OV203_07055 [Nannocystis sp. ILAH1]|uniref:hypothetical protein n=1 Tax=Nannocystis sp. ILAH1 TaxID=2996789 RepID=UPI002270CCEB|nr:hypothetical protein [Nannocystis sp. ILAH1]MCY0986873.1 hypothetical protein [Nannocystis sp. ILAH1]